MRLLSIIVLPVDVGEDFGDGGKSRIGDQFADLDRIQELGEFGILAHLDAACEGKPQDLFGDKAAAGSDDAGCRVGAFLVLQRDRNLAVRGVRHSPGWFRNTLNFRCIPLNLRFTRC